MAADPERIFRNDKTPTIADVRQLYGLNAAEAWLQIQINDLAEYAGVKLKLTQFQLTETARAFSRTYFYITLPEFMLFFAWFKSGHYGTFYGAVDPMVILSSFRKFLDERDRYLTLIEQKNAEAEREEWQNDESRMTLSEWKSYKPFRDAGYDIQFWRSYLRCEVEAWLGM